MTAPSLLDLDRDSLDRPALAAENARLRDEVARLKARVRKDDERRRAMVHIMDDLSQTNRRLSDQRRAMLHILSDYEQDRRRLASQTERLDNSRKALLHILQDSHLSNMKLEASRKAMIHIMGDLRETTSEIQQREQELRDKQEQLIQAGKLATLGELTTGVAHELNNPLNNIGLFLGNIADEAKLGVLDSDRLLATVDKGMHQVAKASEIISHLRTFGRAAAVTSEPVDLNETMVGALSLLQEQLRLRNISVQTDLATPGPVVLASPIQLEQVFINLLTNARDALDECETRLISIRTWTAEGRAGATVDDSGNGIPPGLENRIFDPFFTTKEVGQGTGLGLSITYGIVTEHGGTITVENRRGGGARFQVLLPLAGESGPRHG